MLTRERRTSVEMTAQSSAVMSCSKALFEKSPPAWCPTSNLFNWSVLIGLCSGNEDADLGYVVLMLKKGRGLHIGVCLYLVALSL